jgi:hypothetical protein
MKFQFNGGQDCPDWVLAEMATLSKLTSIKTRMVCEKVCQEIINEGIDELTCPPDDLLASISQLTSDADFKVNDVKATIAAVNFIISSSGYIIYFLNG